MPQVHRSVEGVYHNGMNKVLPLVLLLAGFGAGCASPAKPNMPTLPEIKIESPTNGSVTSSSNVLLIGQSNVPAISVNGQPFDASSGRFAVRVLLLEGSNSFEIIGGNGYTSSSLILNVTRETPSSSAE